MSMDSAAFPSSPPVLTALAAAAAAVTAPVSHAQSAASAALSELEWVFGQLTREVACAMLLSPPWSGRRGCFLVRRKGPAISNSFVLSVVSPSGQILHHFLRLIDDKWIVQHSVERPCAPSSVSLLDVVRILRDPNGHYALELTEMIVPQGVQTPLL
jgi:hypothetical protein